MLRLILVAALLVSGCDMTLSRRLLTAHGSGGTLAPPVDVGEPVDGFGVALPDTFTKYASNPIVVPGANGTWNDGEVMAEHVHFDTRLDQFVMVASGWDGANWRIGIYYAPHPLGPWVEDENNPVFESDGVTEIWPVAATIVQLPDETYRMYYQNYSGGTSDTIKMATSSDLVDWTRANDNDPVLAGTGNGGDFDQSAVFDPFPRLMDDGTTELFYAAYNSGIVEHIGKAVLDTDGITVLSRGLLYSPESGQHTTQAFGAIAVIGGEAEYGAFNDWKPSGGGGRRIDHRWTTDGSSFQYELALSASASGWDGGQVFDSSPVWWNDVLYLFYSGGDSAGDVGGFNGRIGVAFMDYPLT